jgi:hypothetical protein
MKLKLSISMMLVILLTLSVNVMGARADPPLDPGCTVYGYSATYDGNDHTADGSCTASSGTLDLSGTTHKDVGNYTTDTWSFHDDSGTYADNGGPVSDSITPATAACTVSGYSGTYDGAAHGASVTYCTGVLGEDLSASVTLGSTFTDVPGGTANWTFSNLNYYNPGGSVPITINPATATCAISGYTGIYDGAPHGASGSCTGVGGEDLSASVTLGSTFTNVPGGTANWTFTNTNYISQGSSVSIVISKAAATINVLGYTGVYDGQPHGATGTATGVNSEDLGSLLHLGGSFTNGPGGTANWIFDGNTNYNSASSNVEIVINKINASCTVTPYSGTYDGNAHGVTGTCTGLGGVTLDGLIITGTFTDAPGGTAHWTFSNANYNDQSSDTDIVIAKADAICLFAGFSGIYNGNAHGASGTCTGVLGEDLSTSVNPGSTFIDVPGGQPHWTFTGGTNYKDQDSYVTISIGPADSITTVTCPASITYTGSALTPCSVTVTGAGSLSLTPSPDYVNNVNAGTATASYTFSDNNHTVSSDSKNFTINQAAQATVTVTGPSSITYGTTGTATATGGSSTGAVSFDAGSSTGCSVTGTTVSVINTSGTCSLTATKAGDANYQDSATSAAYPVTLNKAAQAAVTVTGPGSITYGTTGTATAAGGDGTGAYSFSSGSSTGCSVLGTTVSVSNASGTCSLTAIRLGDNNYQDSATSVAYPVTLIKIPQTTAVTVTDPSSITYGTTGTATAAGGDSTGAYSFSSGSSTGCSVLGTTVSVSDASLTCSLTAIRLGDNNYLDSTPSVAFPVTLNKAAQAALTVTAPSSITYGTPGTATSTGGSGTGAVTFNAGSSTGCSVAGTTVSVILTSGTCSLTATKAGDNNYQDSIPSVAYPVTINKAAQSPVTVTAPTTTITISSPGTAAASGGSGTGAYIFSAGASTGCTVSGTAVTVTNSTGTCLLTAYRAADDNYLQSATSAARTVTMAKAAQATLTVTGPIGPITILTTNTATSSGGSGTGAVTFSRVSGGGGCSVSGTTVTVTDSTDSPCRIRANKAADNNYNASGNSATFPITMARASQATLTVSGPSSITYGSTGTATATGGSGGGSLSFSIGSSTGCSRSGTTISVTDVNGTCVLTATKDRDNNYSSKTSDPFTVSLQKASSIVTVNCTPGSFPYTGSPWTPCTATATGAGGLNQPITLDQSNYTDNTNQGNATVSVTWPGDTNHTGYTGTGSFTITAPGALCTVTTLSLPYNGLPQTTATGECHASDTGVDITYGLDLSPTIHTNAGTYNDTWIFHDPNIPPQFSDTSGPVPDVITQGPTTTDVTCPPGSFAYTGSSLRPCTATVTLTSTGALVQTTTGFTSNSGSSSSGHYEYDYDNNTSVGTANLWYHYRTNGNYLESEDQENFVITPRPTTTTVTCPVGPYTYTGSEIHPCTAVVIRTSDGVQIRSTTMSSQIFNSNNNHYDYLYSENTNAGTATATYHYRAGDNYAASEDDETFLINQAQSTLTISCPATAFYTGDPIEPCVATWSIPGGLTGTIPPTYANNVEVGTATVNATFAGDDNIIGSTAVEKTFAITGRIPTCTIIPYTVTYDGNPHTATGTCTGSEGEDLTLGLDLSATTHSGPVDTYSDRWTYTDYTGNYADTVGTITDTIGKADPFCTVTGYNVPYDGEYHYATGTCIGVLGETLDGLDLSDTRHRNRDDYQFDTWHFTDESGNYNDIDYDILTGPYVHDAIGQNNVVTCNVSGYNVPYDGNPHTATGTCTTSTGEDLSSSLNLNETTRTDRECGLWFIICLSWSHLDEWTFTNPNYPTQTGTVITTITSADPICTVTGYNVPYDGIEHIATGTCNGSSSGLNLNNTRHTAEGTYTDNWSFNSPNDNYNDDNGTVSSAIGNGFAICTVPPYTVTYDGNPHTPTYSCTGTDGVALTGTFTVNSHTDAGTFTDTWTFTDSTGTFSDSGSVSDRINRADPSCTVTGYNVFPDGNTHTATGFCIGVRGGTLPGLDLSGTTHGANGEVGTWNDPWTFTDLTGNYNNLTGTVTDTISDNAVICTVTQYVGFYDGLGHTPIGACIGASGPISEGLDLGTPYYDVPGSAGPVTWTFNNPSYPTQSGRSSVVIRQAATAVTVTFEAGPYTYRNSAYTATARVTGPGGLDQDLPVVYSGDCTNVTSTDGCTASATFTGGGNYTGSYDTESITIEKAPTTTVVTFEAGPYTYRTTAFTATARVTGPGLDQDLPVNYSGECTNVTAGGCTATATFAGDANYIGSEDSKTITIAKAPSTTVLTFEPGPYTYRTTAFTATANVTSVGGLNQPVAVVYSGDCLNVTSANGCTATATFAGDQNHDVSSDSKSITIVRASSTTVLTFEPGPYTYRTTAFTATANVTGVGGLNQPVAVVYSGDCTNVTAGGCTATATFAGNQNHDVSSDTKHITINKADPVCTITPYTVTYDGSVHSVTGLCKGIAGVTLSGLDLSGTTHTDAGDYPADAWTFTDVTGNYNNTGGTVHDSIGKADVICYIAAYSGVLYDGNPHTATGFCTGIGGVTLSGIDLSGTTHTDAGDYPADAWTFTDSTGNYNNTNETVHDSIVRANATCTVSGYTGVYDAASHGATGSCTGVGGVTLSGLDLGATFTDVPGGKANWTFSNANYNDQSGDKAIVISKADATCTVGGFTGSYSGDAQGASGTCTGVKGETLSGLDLGVTFTNVPGGNAHWTFTGGTNYNDQQGGEVVIAIDKGPAVTSVSCPNSVPFTGSAQTPCTALVTGAGGLEQSLMVNYTDNRNAGVVTASASYAGDPNHLPRDGYASFEISKASSSVQVTCPMSITYTGQALAPCTALVTSAGGLNLRLIVYYTNNTQAGTAVASATYTGDANHAGNTSSKTFTITSIIAQGIPPGVGDEETTTDTSVIPPSTARNTEGSKQDSASGSDMKAAQLTNATQVAQALPTPTPAEVTGSDQGSVSAPVEPATSGEIQSASILSTYSGLFGCIGAGFLGLLIFFMFKRRKKEDPEENK